ncbi:MAG: GNAT family N-acetyltransferase [Planctomycetota bacterium]
MNLRASSGVASSMEHNSAGNEPDEIRIQLESDLTPSEFIDVLERSTLAQRRPVDDAGVIAGMLKHADLIATARNSVGLLIGVARSITDYHYCTYLSDLAVDVAFQRRGIGKQLIDFTHDSAGKSTTLILLAAPAAENYYPHIGMIPHQSCWIQREDP